MVNISGSSTFFQVSSSYFLYYSWIELKFLISSSSYYVPSKPVNTKWFLRTSLLLRKGMYNYNCKKFINWTRSDSKTFSFYSLRNKIIENALFNILFPFVIDYFIRKKFSIYNNLWINFGFFI